MKKFLSKKLILVSVASALLFSLFIVSACDQQNKIQEGKFPNTVAENAKVADQYVAIANEMSDFAIKELTENISKIPRKSKNCEQIHKYLYNWATQNNLKVNIDQSGCVYWDVPATPGCENYPNIILQAHTDMVHTTNDESIDMNTTPIDVVFDESINGLHSKDYKTNIGADDGEGLVTMMALSTNTNFKHGPLRMLCTYDEEITMEGAMRLSPEVLNANYLLNVDAGPVGSACVSSAGILRVGFNNQYQLAASNKNSILEVELKDLAGGHSGVDIAKNRLCANVCASQILQKLVDENIEFNLINMYGGEGPNIISSKAYFSIAINESDVENAKNIIENEFNSQKNGHNDDKNAYVWFNDKKESNIAALSINDTKTVVKFINELPHGVREMSEVRPDMPAVSSNFGTITLYNGQLKVVVHSRSNKQNANDELDKKFVELSKQYGIAYSVDNKYAAWENSEDKTLSNLFAESFKNTSGIETVDYISHAGLECSRLYEKNPNLKMLSIGMDVADEHMVTETLYTKSMPAFFASFIYFLENANQL